MRYCLPLDLQGWKPHLGPFRSVSGAYGESCCSVCHIYRPGKKVKGQVEGWSLSTTHETHIININISKKILLHYAFTLFVKKLSYTGFSVWEKKVKGLVHPKMKIKSLITHPYAVPTPEDLHSSSEHKWRYFWLNLRGGSLLHRLPKGLNSKMNEGLTGLVQHGVSN